MKNHKLREEVIESWRRRQKQVLETDQYRLAKRMKWWARVIGLGFSFIFLIFLGGSIAKILDSFGPIPIEAALLGILMATGLAGCLISWWRERLAGTLLILAAFGLVTHSIVMVGFSHITLWSTFGLPYLIAGVLFFSSWWLSRETP